MLQCAFTRNKACQRQRERERERERGRERLHSCLVLSAADTSPILQAVNDLLRETVTLCQFDHPNIVRVIGVVLKPTAMVVLEYCERGCLQTMLTVESPYQMLTLGAKLKAVLDVATGMEAVAACGVVHLDLATRNILVSRDFQFKVADFGMARSSSGITWSSDPQYSDAAQFSYEFTAEDWAGRPLPIRWSAIEVIAESTASEASDIWSFGVRTCAGALHVPCWGSV
jgi:serine/threonine protein kinase